MPQPLSLIVHMRADLPSPNLLVFIRGLFIWSLPQGQRYNIEQRQKGDRGGRRKTREAIGAQGRYKKRGERTKVGRKKTGGAGG